MSKPSRPPRPSAGAGHYLRDLVYGASDGVVTTLALIAGSTGAGFPAAVGLVLGLANLIADGLSMAVSNYLGLKSELEQTGASVDQEQPWRHGMATLVAFVVAGAVPLASYALPVSTPTRWRLALGLGLVTLAVVGAARSGFIRRPAWRCALEMVLLAGAASAVAYLIGAVLGPSLR